MVFGINKKHGQPLDIAKTKQKLFIGISSEMLVYLLTLPFIALIVLIFSRPSVMDVALPALTIMAFLYIVYRAFRFTKPERLKLFAALISFLVWILFLALYEQSSGSFNLFVLHNMNFRIGNITLPGLSINNFLPGFLPAIMMPLTIFIWRKLSLHGSEPGTVMKFIIGFLFMAAFFGLFWSVAELLNRLCLFTFVVRGLYFDGVKRTLCTGPILYSLTYKLSPRSIVSTMMRMLELPHQQVNILRVRSESLRQFLPILLTRFSRCPTSLKYMVSWQF